MRISMLALCVSLPLAAPIADDATAADIERGEKVFKRCQVCHTLEAGGAQEKGPNLHGLFGREAGTSEGWEYSEAMRESDVVWNEETLDSFLADPKNFIKGNTMPFTALRKPDDRTNVIAYLQEATQ